MNRPAILIIDNDQSWINNLREHLGRTYNIDVAQNSIEAMEKLSQDNYELLIVSSLEIAALENIHSLYPTKRLVVVTNKPTTQEAIKMYDYGAMDYLAKEFDQDISSKMEQVIKIPVIAS